MVKKRIGEKKFVSNNEKKAIRLQLGVSGNSPINEFNKYEVSGLTYQDLYGFSESNFGVSISTGLEWQRQKKKIQYFYGIGIGGGYGKRQNLGNVLNTNNTGISRYSLEISKGYSINTEYFGGVKYFLSPEFSLSLESGFIIGYSNDTIDIELIEVSSKTSTETNLQTRNAIHYRLSYLRYLNFSYYF